MELRSGPNEKQLKRVSACVGLCLRGSLLGGNRVVSACVGLCGEGTEWCLSPGGPAAWKGKGLQKKKTTNSAKLYPKQQRNKNTTAQNLWD